MGPGVVAQVGWEICCSLMDLLDVVVEEEEGVADCLPPLS